MRIDDIEVGKSYAYAPSPLAATEGNAVEVKVLRIDALSPSHPRGASKRNVRTPFVRRADTGEEMHLPAKDLIEPWAKYRQRVKGARGKLHRAEQLDAKLQAALEKQGVKAFVHLDVVMNTPVGITIRVPYGADGEGIARLVEALRGKRA